MITRLTRPLAALFLLLGGIVHYKLWEGGYRHVPKIGPLFLANFVVSIVLAVAVVMRRRITTDAAATVFAAGSLAALILSRTVGIFGFTENVWTPQAINTVAAELGAILALAIAVTAQIHRNHQMEGRLAEPITAPINPGRRVA